MDYSTQTSLYITSSWSLHKLMSLESVMPSSHLILCWPLLLLPSIFPSIRVFSNELALCIRWPKYWSFSFSISPSNEYSEQISFRMDWLDLLAVQGTLKRLLQHHSSKMSILQCSAFFMSNSHICTWWLENYCFAYIDLCRQSKWKRRVEKVGLKLNIQKTKIMASGPITSCQIDGETVETVADFIFLGSKITADGDWSHGIKRCLLLGRKVMTNLYSILKSRDITLPTKVHLVKAMVFPVVMYECESWTVKKGEHRRTDASELWCWRRLLRVPGLQGDPTSPS